MKNIIKDLNKRPLVLTIAGFDPSAGAGVLSDIKTFENIKTYGLAVQTALTVQTDEKFISCYWTPLEQILEQTRAILDRFKSIKAVKIGIIENNIVLLNILRLLQEYYSDLSIIWDPIIKASTGFSFQTNYKDNLNECLKHISILTPNKSEMELLFGKDYQNGIEELTKYCSIYLKGGHNLDRRGEDIFYSENFEPVILKPSLNNCYDKHGSGCVLSAALSAYLGLGMPIGEACFKAKLYTEQFLQSNQKLLGYHKF